MLATKHTHLMPYKQSALFTAPTQTETGLIENKSQGKECQRIQDCQVNVKNTCNWRKIRFKSQQLFKKCFIFLAQEMLPSSANEIKVLLTEGFGLGGTWWFHLIPTPCHGQDTFHYPRLLKHPSNLALHTSRDGASKTSLGNLCHFKT